MGNLGLPSVFVLVVLLSLIPAVQAILNQFFPSTEYWYSALIVAILGAILKALQVTYGSSIPTGDAPAGAAGAPAPQGPGKLRRWLL